MDIQVEIHLSYDSDVWAYGMVTLENMIRFPVQLQWAKIITSLLLTKVEKLYIKILEMVMCTFSGFYFMCKNTKNLNKNM